MSEPVIRVLIADDHPVVRKGLCATIEEDPQLEVVGEAGDGERALELIQQLAPDVAVIDINMPRLGGFGVIAAMQQKRLGTRVIFLTLHAEGDMLRAAFDAGVTGYLLKDSAMMEVEVAVHAVASGQMYVSASMTTQLLQPATPAPQESGLLRDLTVSERRILRLIATGMASKEIGAELSVHYRTVENHRTNICRKLGIDGSNALLRFALQHKKVL